MLPAVAVAGQDAVLLTSPSSTENTALSAVKSKLAERGGSVLEIPTDEADIAQAGIIGNGGPVVVADPASPAGYKAYDGNTGADVTAKVQAGLPLAQPAAAPLPAPAPEPKRAEPRPEPAKKPAPAPESGDAPRFERNHIGLAAGLSNLRKNEDSLNVLAANMGAEARYDKTVGRFRLIYEHYFTERYGVGIAAGTQRGGRSTLDVSGRTLNVTETSGSVTLYVLRRFGNHFGLYLGGGEDVYSLTLEDPSNLAGLPSANVNFTADAKLPHAEAGMVLSAGSFSLRFTLKQTFGQAADSLTATSGGTKYRLITVGNSALGYKTAGQPLAANEKYFSVDPGGFASAVTLSWMFGNW
ncbi:MAG: hypothetical protein M0025_01415 [Elusimicrobia bacterium]|nr:hypothetical protein [Elusimicrobiota bacterium]